MQEVMGGAMAPRGLDDTREPLIVAVISIFHRLARKMTHIIAIPLSWFSLKRGGLPMIISVTSAVVMYLLMATRPSLAPAPQTERIWPVNAVTANYTTIQPNVTVFGEVVTGRKSEMRTLVPGPIIEIGPMLRDGGEVQKGDLLVRIDPFDYETTLAEQKALLAETKTQLEILRRKYQRTKELRKGGNVSQQEVDNAFLNMKRQRSIVDQRDVGVQRARRNLLETELRAPFSGVVNHVNANLGKQLGINDKVVDLIDTDSLEVKFSLSNSRFGRLLDSNQPIIGRPLKVLWRVGDTVLTYNAKIKRSDAQISSSSGGVSVYAAIESSSSKTFLRPGAFVWVKFAGKAYHKVLRVPDSAVYNNNTIYVVNESSRLEARQIAIQGYDGNHILFQSTDGDGEPIENGDLIVTTQLREVGTGVQVAVR